VAESAGIKWPASGAEGAGTGWLGVAHSLSSTQHTYAHPPHTHPHTHRTLTRRLWNSDAGGAHVCDCCAFGRGGGALANSTVQVGRGMEDSRRGSARVEKFIYHPHPVVWRPTHGTRTAVFLSNAFRQSTRACGGPMRSPRRYARQRRGAWTRQRSNQDQRIFVTLLFAHVHLF
jgi:hypothetical protein